MGYLSIMDFENLKKKFFFFDSFLNGKVDDKPSVIHNSFQKFEENFFFLFHILSVKLVINHGLSIIGFKNLKKNFFFFSSLKVKVDDKP